MVFVAGDDGKVRAIDAQVLEARLQLPQPEKVGSVPLDLCRHSVDILVRVENVVGQHSENRGSRAHGPAWEIEMPIDNQENERRYSGDERQQARATNQQGRRQ